MIKYKVIQHAYISECKQNIHKLGEKLLPVPSKVEVVQYKNGVGYYLLRLNNKDEEITDTYHSSIQDACEQCFFEYGIQKNDWILIN